MTRRNKRPARREVAAAIDLLCRIEDEAICRILRRGTFADRADCLFAECPIYQRNAKCPEGAYQRELKFDDLKAKDK